MRENWRDSQLITVGLRRNRKDKVVVRVNEPPNK